METTSQLSEDYDRQIRALEAELRSQAEESKRLLAQAREAPAEIARVKQQAREAKAQAQKDLERADRRVEEAEAR